MLLQTMQSIPQVIAEHINIYSNKNKVIDHQHANNSKWYHYLMPIMFFVLSLVPTFILVKELVEVYNNIYKEISLFISLLLISTYTGYVAYKMIEYNSIENNLEIDDKYSRGYEYCVSLSACTFRAVAVFIILFYLFRPILADLGLNENIFLLFTAISYIGIQYLGTRPIIFYNEHLPTISTDEKLSRTQNEMSKSQVIQNPVSNSNDDLVNLKENKSDELNQYNNIQDENDNPLKSSISNTEDLSLQQLNKVDNLNQTSSFDLNKLVVILLILNITILIILVGVMVWQRPVTNTLHHHYYFTAQEPNMRGDHAQQNVQSNHYPNPPAAYDYH